MDDWAGPPGPDAGGNLAVERFNDYLAARGSEARSPIVAATTFLRLDEATATTTSIVTHATGEGSGPTTVTVTLDRLPDDSVRGRRSVLVFVQENGEWRLASATSTQRCWPNRGHQDFSTDRCL